MQEILGQNYETQAFHKSFDQQFGLNFNSPFNQIINRYFRLLQTELLLQYYKQFDFLNSTSANKTVFD